MNATVVEQESKSPTSVWVSGLIGIAAALVGSLALFGIARLLDLPLLVAMGPPGQSAPVPMTVMQIVIVVVISGLAATAFYALLKRFFEPRADRIFQVIAVIILVLSLGAPLTQDVTTVNKLLLALMHVVTAAAFVWALALRK